MLKGGIADKLGNEYDLEDRLVIDWGKELSLGISGTAIVPLSRSDPLAVRCRRSATTFGCISLSMTYSDWPPNQMPIVTGWRGFSRWWRIPDRRQPDGEQSVGASSELRSLGIH